MDKAEFMGNRVLIDSFGSIDNERLELLFKDDPNNSYTPLTSAELTALSAIPACIVDRQYFMIFDNLAKFTENYNGEGIYWQYFYHVWKTFSTSPFANAALFVPATPTVTSVTISPTNATAKAGDIIGFAATVATSNFAPKSVVWSVAGKGTITQEGVLTVGADAVKSDTITVTVTSTFDSTKKAQATVTIS